MGIVAYAGAAAVAWIASPQGVPSLAHLAGIGSLAASALLVADLATDEARRRTLVRAAAVGAVAAAAAALLGGGLFLAGIPTPLVGPYGDLVPGPYPRLQGPSTHPNLLASVCLFGSAMVASAGGSKRAERAAQAVLVAALVFTFSRTLVTFALATLWRSSRVPRPVAWAATLLAALLVFLPTVVNVHLDPTRPWAATVDAAPSPRAQALTSALHTWASDPLTGIGPGLPPGRVGEVPYDAHFTAVNVAATLGLPALVALAAALALLGRAERPRRGHVVWALLLAMAVDSLATDVEDFRHLWIAMGLVASRARRVTPA